MSSPLSSAQPTFIHSDRALARAAQPIVRFLHIEAAGGILLVIATVVALVWANSPWRAGYEAVWSTEVRIGVGSYVFEEDVGHIVNDALMALFFFVVGMEIKRELVVGELRDRRAVALPAMAALGGMIVPALIFTLFNAGGDGARGWGIPMATDIAFALGVVALLGSRVPPSVKVLLLSLAIIDDIGAITVIAVFYTDDLDVTLLFVALGITVLTAVAHRAHIVSTPLLVALAFGLWLVIYESGVHATIAGVVMGLLTPARPMQSELATAEIVDVLDNVDVNANDIRATAAAIAGSVSACDRLIDALHPWTSYLIVPVFALANAGIVVSADSITDPSSVLTGVAVALVVGKLTGVALFSWLAVRLGFGRLPDGARWGHVLGVGALAGIGFTVSLFITGLAFDDTELPGAALQDEAKIGILIASVVASIVGAAILVLVSRRAPAVSRSD